MVKKGTIKKLKKAYKVYKNSYGNRTYATASMKASNKRIKKRKDAYYQKKKYQRAKETQYLKQTKADCKKIKYGKHGGIGWSQITRGYYYAGCNKWYGELD